MTTQKKRPSVKNKKIARPASRQASAAGAAPAVEPSTPAGEVGVVASDVAVVGGESPFPSVPDMPNPPTAEDHIPFADVSNAAAADDGPADFFDLGDETAFSAKSSGASRPTASASKRPRTRVEAHGGDKAERTAGRAKPKTTRSHKDAAPSRRDAAKGAGSKSGMVRKAVLAIVGVIAVAALAVGAFFVWNTFLRYDDAADIQGEWRTQDGSMTVVIDGTDIRMPDLEYSYEIDTGAKRLTFHFSDLTGSGTYAFSEDRSQLTIVEGEGEAAAVTVLVRVSDNTQATPQLLSSGDAAADAPQGDTAAAQGDAAPAEGDASAEEGA